ncbi:MAG: hypothetical protein C4523_02560 [Myxococcales bacterium]|nr:MAG: hypothetical protein C4523_02560 [Myxococcales bacterium]
MRILAFILMLVSTPALGQILGTIQMPCAPSELALMPVEAAGYSLKARAADEDGSLWMRFEHKDGRYLLLLEFPQNGLTCRAGGGDQWEATQQGIGS